MKPTLVIMAAGMGSRFGGPKQITPVDNAGHVILDYSVYDAVRAGFDRVICVIKEEKEQEFRQAVGDRIAARVPVEYAYQKLDDLPAGFSVPEGRQKPWGTGHAVLACRRLLHGEPFAVINADDFYGYGAFRALADFFDASPVPGRQCLITYRLRNTLTENGTVARGVCDLDEQGRLLSVTEHLKIRGPFDAPSHTLDGSTWLPLNPDAPVSMNTWGFSGDFIQELEKGFTEFLKNDMPKAPTTAEYYLLTAANALINSGRGSVCLQSTDEKWYGVTYREDLEPMKASLRRLIQNGVYPEVF